MPYNILEQKPVTVTNTLKGIDFKFNEDGVFKGLYLDYKQARANLINLLLTQIGERVMQPEFGSNLLAVIFQPNTDAIKPLILDAIYDAVEKWVPYIDVNVEVITADDDPSLTDTVRIIINGIVDNVRIDPIVVFASEAGISISDRTE